MSDAEYDVVVVGAGNAGLCAALSAREQGAERVLVLERAPRAERGGNSRFTAGAFRFAYEGVEDLRDVMVDLTDREVSNTDFGSYSSQEFFDDMARVTQYRADPDLVETLVTQSLDTMKWMHRQGVRFLPMYRRQAFRVEGRFKFWGGLTVEASGGGEGLMESLYSAADAQNIDVWYGSRAVELLIRGSSVAGVEVVVAGQPRPVMSSSVILASGGFEANSEWRCRYLGPGWDLAKVRGTRFNTGDGISMALRAGALPHGNWSGAHAVAWDLNAPEFGDLAVGDGFQKHSYPLGIMVNALGERFVDEGADFRNYTYAKYGQEILRQPYQTAWQIFDATVTDLLRDEYHIREVTKVQADTLQELAEKMAGVDSKRLLATIEDFNGAVRTDIAFDPTVRDGRSADGLEVPKSNWANPLSTPPYTGYATTCGITFTFGGLQIDNEARVVSAEGSVIPGLFAAGELVGGLFYFNYPGGTGLTSGSVFGRLAGRSAATYSSGPAWIDGNAKGGPERNGERTQWR